MYDYFYMHESEQYQFLQMPWLLIKDEQFKTISSDAKILYSLLLNRTSLSKKNGWLDELGRVYLIYTVDEIKDDLNCGRDKAMKSMQELTKKGLVETVRRGLGKPNLVYVKNFATSLKYPPGGNTTPTNLDITQKSDISTSGSRKYRPQEVGNSGIQEVGISDTSNTDISKIDTSDIYTMSESKSKSDRTMTIDSDNSSVLNFRNKKEPSPTTAVQSSVVESTLSSNALMSASIKYDFNTYKKIIQDNIEYSYYVDDNPRDLELIDELINCMLDVICTAGETVKIAGEEKSRAMIISQYLKINNQDIEHIIDKYREQRHKITHLHPYLKTMLYTVKQEANFSVENQVRVDGAVW